MAAGGESGIFSASGVYLFAAGAVLSTLVFLPAVLRNLLNAFVGCVLVFNAVRMMLRRARS